MILNIFKTFDVMNNNVKQNQPKYVFVKIKNLELASRFQIKCQNYKNIINHLELARRTSIH